MRTETGIMFRFRLLKHHSPINVLKIAFTEQQETLLKEKLLENKEAIELLNSKMFDEYGQHVSINDSIVQVFQTTLKSEDSVLFPRDKYTQRDGETIIYTSALSLELAKKITPIVYLCETVGMQVHYSHP